MPWQDFFYFSKGERRALTVLLCLLSLFWLFMLTSRGETEPVSGNQHHPHSIASPLQDSFPKRKNIPGSSGGKTANRSFSSTKTGYRRSFYQTEKLPAGTIVELNTADTLLLKKVPGIGSTFSRRIFKYRELLGGFYTVEQLGEVYGIDAERYASLSLWFSADISRIRKLSVNQLPASELRKHPYISYRQAQTIEQLRKRKGMLSGWENLELLEEFSETDKERPSPYLSFD